MRTSTLVGGSTLTSVVGGMFQMIGVPRGAVLAIVFIGLVGTIILNLAQVAMPQESQDKRLLWERFFEYRERRHIAASADKSHPAALEGSPTPSEGTVAHSR